MEAVAVDFSCWLVDRGFMTMGLQVGCFGSTVYMGVWAMCGGHGGLDFGVCLSQWLLVFWRRMGFRGLQSVSLWVAYGSIEICGCFVLCGCGDCWCFCGGCGHHWLLV